MKMTSPSYTIDNLGTSLRFCFRSRDKDYRTVIFVIYSLSFSTCLSLCAGMMFLAKPPIWQSIKDFQSNTYASLWLLFFLSILLYIIISTWFEIFWRMNGKEIVEISGDGIEIHHQNLSFRITETFSAKTISCIFISRHKESESIIAFLSLLKERRFSSFNRGKIAFNYGKNYDGNVNTLRFGSILDPDEARQVVAIIHEKFPQYKCPAKSVA